MPSSPDPSSDPELHFLDEPSARLLATQLRGIGSVTLRIVGTDPHAEGELVAFLAALGLPAQVTHLGAVIPPPLRRFSFQFSGKAATITVAPGAPLKG